MTYATYSIQYHYIILLLLLLLWLPCTRFVLELEFPLMFLQLQNMGAILNDPDFYKTQGFREDMPPKPLLWYETGPKKGQRHHQLWDQAKLNWSLSLSLSSEASSICGDHFNSWGNGLLAPVHAPGTHLAHNRYPNRCEHVLGVCARVWG